MNKLLSVVVVASTVALGGNTSVLAEEEQTRAVPVEFFACNWQDGKGMKDLDKVSQQFSEWAKKHDMAYSAWTLTPQFHNAAGFDLGWLGSWNSAIDFGKGQDVWNSKGGDLGAKFAEVIDCSDRHELVSSVEINAPDGPPGDGVVMFSACTLMEGKNLGDSFEAHKKLAAAMGELGNPASSWLFYPGLGAGDIDFHYWRVIGFNNYSELGAAAEIHTNGGGWQKTQEILGSVVSCGSPGVFDARQVVAGQ